MLGENGIPCPPYGRATLGTFQLMAVVMLRATRLPDSGVDMQPLRAYFSGKDIRLTTHEIAEGAIIGAFAGDAAGATLEFMGETPSEYHVERALRMVGRGYWRTAPGQITDDGELAMCLMYALAGRSTFDVERVAQAYLWWYKSNPFDIGITTINGLTGGVGLPKGEIHTGMQNSATKQNSESKSNGSLMRIAPLGIWGHRVSADEIAEAARADSALTHANPTCQHACAAYTIALRHLVLHPGDGVGAFDAAARYTETLPDSEVSRWLREASELVDPGYTPHQGFVRYGFTHAFRHLVQRTHYQDAIHETLIGGGDTDTNACIVGAMVGALHGIDDIPDRMRLAVLQCDTEKGRPRPTLLQTRVQMPALIHRIVD